MRRTLARIVLVAVLIGMISSVEMDFAQMKAPEFAGGGVRADSIFVPDTIELPARLNVNAFDFTPAYENETQFLSPILTPDFAFDAVGVSWEEVRPTSTNINFQVRFQHQNNQKWGDWNILHPDPDDNPDSLTASTIDEIVSTVRSRAIQYKVILESVSSDVTPQVKNVNFHYIDGAYNDTQDDAQGTQKLGQSPDAELKKLLFADGSFNIISRSEWGADESWRTNDFFGYEP
ncbi:hypothetical protein HN748_03615, partial [Candidatus Peregrinibacteria bacterium]|nr:hypothetical protein [Candidatus Peregrinibacteria bacterium]